MKLLVIVGPTSSGKTSLGIKLCKEFDGEIVSADSRQVYKRLDIGTGKDIPDDSGYEFVSEELGGYYLIEGVRVWGYDLVGPKEDFSVTNYILWAKKIIDSIQNSGSLPVVVGGTGFYIKGLINGIETAKVPRNETLRVSLNNYSIDQLFEKLAKVAPQRAAQLNISDKSNPRRLIRAIEVGIWKINNNDLSEIPPVESDTLMIGLKPPLDKLRDRIKRRVHKRLDKGFESELEDLLSSGVTWQDQSMQTFGYRQWKDYLIGKITRKEAIEDWVSSERRYAKKQMTWFKKDQRINWFDQSGANWDEEVLQLVQDWINKA